MKKIKYRRLKTLSLVLSVIMIMCSISMTATAEPIEPTKNTIGLRSDNDDSITVESYEASDPTLDWQGLPINSKESLALASTESVRDANGEVTAGVYAFKNVENEGLWIDTRDDSYDEGAYIQQYAYSSNPANESVFSRGGLFKISKHPTHGTYIIRSMLNNRYTFTLYSTNGTNYIRNQAIPLNDAEVSVDRTFYIEYDSNLGGYTIKPYGTNYYVTSCHESASGASGGTASYLQFASSATTESAWTMSKYLGIYRRGGNWERYTSWADIGLVVDTVYNTRIISWSTITNYNTPYISPTDECVDLVDYTWEPTSEIISMTPRFPGELNFRVGVALSSDNIHTTNNIFDIVDADTMQAPSYRIVPQEGAYYIQNAGTEKYIDIEGLYAVAGAQVIQFEYVYLEDPDLQMMWEIEHVSDSGGYVRIKSAAADIYLGVNPSELSDIILTEEQDDYSLWKIDTTSRKTLAFYCCATEDDELAMFVPNTTNRAAIIQTTYVNDATDLKDEWHIVKKVISMVNYYDSNFSSYGSGVFIDYIDDAVSFANIVYARYLCIGIYMDGNAQSYESVMGEKSIAEQCTTGNTQVCSYDICGSICKGGHHKNVKTMSDQLMANPRTDDHIYVLWANRYFGYCYVDEDNNHKKSYAIGTVCNKRPIININYIAGNGYPEKLACMAIGLSHEITHCLNMDDVYDNNVHSENDNSQYICIMDAYNSIQSRQLYENIRAGQAVDLSNYYQNEDTVIGTEPFCSSCLATMKSKVNAYITNDWNIAGN